MKIVHSLLVAALVATGSASAAPVTLTASDAGWYDSFGYHNPSNTNYVTGQSFDLTRSFLVFDPLPSFGGTITSATLRIFNPDFSFASPDASETISFFAINTSLTSLVDGTGDVAAFDDLGDGTVYGSGAITLADEGDWLSFTLNSAFISALQGASGSFGIGMALTSLDPLNTSWDETVFGFSDLGFNAPELRLEVSTTTAKVPDTTVTLALGASLLGLLAAARRLRVAPSAQA